MATLTRHGSVCTLECEVSEFVVECLRIQANHVGLSALVILVTMAALVSRNIGTASVGADLARDVGVDVLVTIETAPGLSFLGK